MINICQKRNLTAMTNKNAKITLSDKELALVTNSDWILTKRNIIDKVIQLFQSSIAGIDEQLKNKQHLPDLWKSVNPKITKGENYQGLPYVVLDHPAVFNKENALAIRTIFHWGNNISVHFYVSGPMLQKISGALHKNWQRIQAKEYFVCSNTTPWEHHFGIDNYTPATIVSSAEFISILEQRRFCKMAKKIPLQEWNNIHSFIQISVEEILSFIE